MPESLSSSAELLQTFDSLAIHATESLLRPYLKLVRSGIETKPVEVLLAAQVEATLALASATAAIAMQNAENER